MGFSIDGLRKLEALEENYQIVINSDDDGFLLCPIRNFNISSSSKIYETMQNLNLGDLTGARISTSRKIVKYLQGDTSPEVYLSIDSQNITFIKAVVQFDKDGVPLTQQYCNRVGDPLYWSEKLEEHTTTPEGYPYKTANGTKIVMGTEDLVKSTEYPVLTYLYEERIVRQINISDLENQIDTYNTTENNRATISKTADGFDVLLKIGDETGGLRLKTGDDGCIHGKLVGKWDGITDINYENFITKDEYKYLMTKHEDYAGLNRQQFVDTANKVGWYLNTDPGNKVFTQIRDHTIIFYLGVAKKSTSGEYVTEQAKNIAGNLLYWQKELSDAAGVNNYGLPVDGGEYVFMTAENTGYPVLMYQYDLTELARFDYESQQDGTWGIVQTFSDISGNTAKIYKNNSKLVMSFKSSTGDESSAEVSSTGGVLNGEWLVKDGVKVVNLNHLSVGNEGDTSSSSAIKDLSLKDNTITYTKGDDTKGTMTLPMGNLSHGSKLFTSDGTFTVPAGVFMLSVSAVGGGGGGGGGYSSTSISNSNVLGGFGGAGQAVIGACVVGIAEGETIDVKIGKGGAGGKGAGTGGTGGKGYANGISGGDGGTDGDTHGAGGGGGGGSTAFGTYVIATGGGGGGGAGRGAGSSAHGGLGGNGGGVVDGGGNHGGTGAGVNGNGGTGGFNGFGGTIGVLSGLQYGHGGAGGNGSDNDGGSGSKGAVLVRW